MLLIHSDYHLTDYPKLGAGHKFCQFLIARSGVRQVATGLLQSDKKRAPGSLGRPFLVRTARVLEVELRAQLHEAGADRTIAGDTAKEAGIDVGAAASGPKG